MIFMLRIALLLITLFLNRYNNHFDASNNYEEDYDYGVFLGCDVGDIDVIGQYKCVVIDAQYFEKSDIEQLRSMNCETIYSYYNIGSLENFRDYYDEYKDLALGEYVGWEEEAWVDVSSTRWQELMVNRACELNEKGIDGLFIDNCDVYYNYPTDEIYQGVVDILSELKKAGNYIVINGGDCFLDRYCNEGMKQGKIVDGINQEDVYTSYDFEDGTYSVSNDDDREYYVDYLERHSDLDLYVLEYANDDDIKGAAYEFDVKEHNYTMYISDNINLEG